MLNKVKTQGIAKEKTISRRNKDVRQTSPCTLNKEMTHRQHLNPKTKALISAMIKADKSKVFLSLKIEGNDVRCHLSMN